MTGRRGLVTALTAVTVVLAGCRGQDGDRTVDLRDRVPLSQPAPEEALRLRITLGSMVTPRQGYSYHRDLADLVARSIGRTAVLVDRETYGETHRLLESGSVDLAFLCARPYVEARDQGLVDLLVVPEVDGRTTYRSLVIVPAASPARTLDDLRGATFAFADPLSNTGRLAPLFALTQRGEDPRSFFGKTSYTYAHDRSIEAVIKGLVGGAAVDSLVWQWLVSRDPGLAHRARIVWESSPYGIHPIATRRGLDPGVRERLREAFLTAHETAEGRAILGAMRIDRFVLGDDRAYDEIREMRTRLEEQGHLDPGGGARR